MPNNYRYLPYYGTLAFFRTAVNGEVVIYINRRKSHSFNDIRVPTLVLRFDSDEKADELVALMKEKHPGAFRYLDETGKHMYDIKGQIDPLFEN